jgi:hypothetical protein
VNGVGWRRWIFLGIDMAGIERRPVGVCRSDRYRCRVWEIVAVGYAYLHFGAWEVKEGWDLEMFALFGKCFLRSDVVRSQCLLRP